jgi:uncharacterized protein YerC
MVGLRTPAAIRTKAGRCNAARLLKSSELTYREVHERTGVST